MDITDALAPTSDQLDAVELVNPRTFTIDTGSALGQRDGKVVAEIRLVDFPRVWRPSKGMLDVLGACWGTDGKQWVGRRVTVYNDPDVMFGRDKVGGVRISHLSHIDGPRVVRIRATGGAGRKRDWRVEPLPDAPATKPAADAATPQQIARIGALMQPAGLDRDGILRFAAETIGRPVKSSSDLTAAEAGAVIDALEPLVDGGGEG